jgi:Tfp pilus assembly protein PilX
LGSGQPQPETVYYRVTARAVGGNPNSVVLLQSIYRRE